MYRGIDTVFAGRVGKRSFHVSTFAGIVPLCRYVATLCKLFRREEHRAYLPLVWRCFAESTWANHGRLFPSNFTRGDGIVSIIARVEFTQITLVSYFRRRERVSRWFVIRNSAQRYATSYLLAEMVFIAETCRYSSVKWSTRRRKVY